VTFAKWTSTENGRHVATSVGTGSGRVNVREDTNLASLYSADVMHKLQFRFLRQKHQLPFAVDVDTGVITTSGRVDRDVICPGAETCDVRVDVAVQPAQYFRVIRVAIAVLDINDNAPRFPDSSVHFEILESAAVGTGLVLPAGVVDIRVRHGLSRPPHESV